ncbi:MAG: ATP-binding protein [Clostridia bacterium]|nr:ATP-binding protein [Clostridia bacterium]
MGQGYLRQRLDVRGTDEVACLATLLERLVYNLLDNALKYTNEKGSIEVNLYQAAEEIVFEVVDTGMGIPEHAQNLVWQRFFRLDKARSREQGGSGLGLSLVRQITELHRAQIDLISEEGVGTKIKVIFPGFNNL